MPRSRRIAGLPWAIASGVALALAFPTPDLHPLVWVALAPLFVVLRDAPPWRRWWMGFAAGFTWRAISLYWISHVMVNHGGMSMPVGAAVTGLLAFWMALNTGLFCLLVPWGMRRGLSGALVLAAAWVSLEYLQTLLPFGFPWSLLGYAAGRSAILMQGADLAGVWGLSFVAVLVNAAVAQRIVDARRALPATLTAAAAVLVLAGYGAVRLAAAEAPLRVAAVQGNVEQGRVWAPEALRAIIQNHVRLTLAAIDEGADLVVWPESSVPIRGGLEGDPSTRAMLAQLARQFATPLVVGSPHYEFDEAGDAWVTNAAFLVRADGQWGARYDKVHLVPWGEYVPVSWLFRFVTPLVEAIAGFRSGAPDQALFADPAAGVPPFAMAICYEIVFPDHVRRQVARGARFIATITNDAWFGDTFAPYQHFSMARLRAVETRRYLVRAANTGISGMVDPWGRVLERSELNHEALLRAIIWPRDELTPYVRWGDVLPRVCVLLAVLGAVLAWRDRRVALPVPEDPPDPEDPQARHIGHTAAGKP
ncbi:MAG: apolipoprotein N-acyltransferase [Acidobacteriota bacterium]|jgi:apolipoprotein N-acyltransferase